MALFLSQNQQQKFPLVFRNKSKIGRFVISKITEWCSFLVDGSLRLSLDRQKLKYLMIMTVATQWKFPRKMSWPQVLTLVIMGDIFIDLPVMEININDVIV